MKKPLRLNIKHLRKKCGLNQVQLARMIGVNQSNLSKFERGLKQPSLERLPILANVLGVTIDDLFDFDCAENNISNN